MAKIDELATLLVNEIDLFEKTVVKLSKQINILEEVKPKLDTNNIKEVFQEMNDKLIGSYKLNEDLYTKLNAKMNSTLAVPKWLIISGFALIASLLLSIGFNLYQSYRIDEVSNQSYEDGVNQVKEHMIEFFKENPKSHKIYESWKAK